VPGPAATAEPAPLPAATPGGDEAAGVTGEAATAAPPVDRAASSGASGADNGDAESAKVADRDAELPVPLPVVASLTLLLAGLVLFAGRALARRRAS
jgi:hypothetical protein